MCRSALADGDPKNGKRVFNKCKACHTLIPGRNTIGPSLHGVLGREAGTVKGFRYSNAMKEANVICSPETLAKYIAAPKKFIPGNRMPFPGLKKRADRENLIAYLKEAGG